MTVEVTVEVADDAGMSPARPRLTQAERRESAELRLLDAALDVVARRGSVRMTLAEVGDAAGCSRGLAAHHFGNKAGLVHALASHIGRRFHQQRERQSSAHPGLAAIVDNIHFYFSRKGGNWTATRALFVMMSESCMQPGTELHHEMVAYNRQALAWFEQHIRLGVKQGEMSSNTDPALTAVILLGAMRGVMQQWLLDDRIKLPAVRDRLLGIVAQVLQTTAPHHAQQNSIMKPRVRRAVS